MTHIRGYFTYDSNDNAQFPPSPAPPEILFSVNGTGKTEHSSGKKLQPCFLSPNTETNSRWIKNLKVGSPFFLFLTFLDSSALRLEAGQSKVGIHEFSPPLCVPHCRHSGSSYNHSPGLLKWYSCSPCFCTCLHSVCSQHSIEGDHINRT